MEREPNESGQFTFINKIPLFVTPTIQLAFNVLIFGVVLIVLFRFNTVIDTGEKIISTVAVNPIALAGGALFMCALAVLNIPLVAAATAGVAIFLLINQYIHP
jgi:hypothetical protein